LRVEILGREAVRIEWKRRSGKEEEGKVGGDVRNKSDGIQGRKDQLHNRMLDKSVLKFMKRA
jgi:hypothetical protein